MGMFNYAPLSQKSATDKPPSQTIESSSAFRSDCDDNVRTSFYTVPKIVSLVALIVCFAVPAAFLANKVYIMNLVQSDQPGPQPEGFFPIFGKVSIAFTGGGGFTRNDSYGDQLWDTLVPLGAGYIRVPNPRQLNLSPSEPINDSGLGYAEKYQASVMHQLHCMGVLRHYSRAYERGLQPPSGMYLHVRHCIEYMRQAILCTADTTLEQANANGAFNAQDAMHQCRDWSLVKAFLEDHRGEDFLPSILGT
ncbi:hypothetical protein BJ878DRAFT_216452 [Calycina marina]|uniref:Uncharacterized protein n=1 Tax=Calycina marina TaxID=1763456 RepID=A0A9P7YYN0_9HELO|nr:hypothetical protein BJ878DRAFT_216452 [Calycina marina]